MCLKHKDCNQYFVKEAHFVDECCVWLAQVVTKTTKDSSFTQELVVNNFTGTNFDPLTHPHNNHYHTHLTPNNHLHFSCTSKVIRNFHQEQIGSLNFLGKNR